jgi:hypothetical protein
MYNKLNNDNINHSNNDNITNHLEQVNMTYVQHMCHSLKYSFIAIMASIIFFIHAFFPNYLIYDGSFLIYNLNNELQTIKKYVD